MRLPVLALAAGAVLAFSAPAHSASRGIDTLAWPHGEAAVGYATEAALAAALVRNPATIVRRIPKLHVAQVRPAGSVGIWAARVSPLPGITYVQRLEERARAAEPALALPAGRALPWEWQYAVTRADTVPKSVQRAASALTIAVIDTGADLTAPDLAAKSPLTFNAHTGTADVGDTLGHGTFVAALAAGSATNGEGVAGFGGDAQLIVIKAAAANGSFTDLDEANAIVYAVEHGARIVNLSFGGPTTSTTERHAVDYAVKRGALLVAAAGNEYHDGNPVEYPAALLQPAGSKGVGGTGLAVAASTTSGARASFSNTGSYLSIAAPGESVFSALSSTSPASRFPRVALPGSVAGLYGYASGTSFAAPEVAGAAALVWAANPLLDAAAVAQVLKESASGHGVWSAELGFGVLDVGAAVSRATGVQPVTAAALLTLDGALAGRVAKLTATLRASAPGVGAGARTVALERFDGAGWARVGEGSTSSAGQVTFRLQLRKGTVRLRARWSGAGDLAGAVSRTLVFRRLS